MDYKDWVAERAQVIADEEYGNDFYHLTDQQQDEVYAEAAADYIDYESAQIDCLYDSQFEMRRLDELEREKVVNEEGGECDIICGGA